MKNNQLKQNKKTRQKVAQKSKKGKQSAQGSENAISKVLADEIVAYHRAHNRLIQSLVASSDNPTFIFAALHAVHAISMKSEQEIVTMLLATGESNVKK